ncbi:CGNR zinc finger domain-containing protein [Tsukamurella sp. 8F]|uniref:CGNR zinc finger domain-containing protein n=1 Tax=unclassified Tsukamurella TaxID=2633480 RepID=UPI0023B97BB0|nr:MULTISPECIES: ABATE domain-containing protein [unclassified Tsukamurella]MDF0529332.1 CGNR zinc finger domain-containing protein [Tsukamurella sp. 8J]MDF0587161.1 CGNR zinc finger domain-containing protein [Tsukamurella sp. 8F]
MREMRPPVSLELVGTVHGRFSEHPSDDLTNPETAAGWLRSNGFPTAKPFGEEDLADLRALRQAIFSVLAAQTEGRAQDPAAVSELNRALQRGHITSLAAVDPRSQHRLTVVEVGADGPEAIAHRIAADALALITGPLAERVRQCSAHTCGSFFLDTSRAGNRKWCSSTACGNRARVAAHRSRHQGGGRRGERPTDHP